MINRILMSLLLTLLALAVAGAQNYHTPSEITKIMEASPIAYQVGIFKPETRSKSPKRPLNHPGYFQKRTSRGIELVPFVLPTKVQSTLESAEKHFAAHRLAEARTEYLKILGEVHEFSVAMTYIGQTYEMQHDRENARTWFLKAVDSNFVDYTPHWFLADLLKSEGKLKEAAREITVAHALNRNNTLILQALKMIYRAQKLKYSEWEFAPQCAVYKKGDAVIVELTKEWAAYALCKAVWAYEPGYRKKMTGSDRASPFDLTEETECLANLVSGHKILSGNKQPQDKAIRCAEKAIEQRKLVPFIIYEIWAPEHPSSVLSLPKEKIEELAEYVLKFRTI
ncbi:MAG: hypothetical protein HYU64_11480 [Armatimonadetes bacterium]|nr:hypothetical protein [Armatimonadota bacterium]